MRKTIMRGRMNRVLKMVISLSVILSTFALSATAETVSVASTTIPAAAGSMVTVPITVTNITSPTGGVANIAAFTISLRYNHTMVTVSSVTAGDLGGDLGMPIVNINNTTGVVNISAFNVSGVSMPTITLANVVLKEAANISAGSSSNLSLTVTALVDSNGISHNSTANNGVISTIPPLPSDVVPYDLNHDGAIEKNEAVQAVVDYFAGSIQKQQAIDVVVAYFNH